MQTGPSSSSMSIYLNNAATSYPKPRSVAEAVSAFILEGGANFSRGSASSRDLLTMEAVIDCREKIATMFGASDARFVTFSANVTTSINTVLRGFLRPGMRVLSTSMEHNAVVRPLRALEKRGVSVEFLSCDSEGYLDIDGFRSVLREKVDLVVLSHASNVCGSLQDLETIASLCSDFSTPFVVDAAQTAGLVEIDVDALGVAAYCFTGHKGLMGPQGIGGIVWNPCFAERCEPLISGGTGSFSHEEVQPSAMPDKFESGTLNMPGIVGLRAALDFIASNGLRKIFEHEMALSCRLLDGLRKIPGITLHGVDAKRPRVPVLAINCDGIDNAVAADRLSSNFGIETRPGIHCAPLAHKTLGTFPSGALRLSPGYFNTSEEMDYTIDAVRRIIDLR